LPFLEPRHSHVSLLAPDILSSRGLDETGSKLPRPGLLVLDEVAIIELGRPLGIVAGDDNADTTTIEETSGEGTNSRDTTRTHVDSVSGILRERHGFGPVDRSREDLLA
jgi:hypothetical protein